MTAERNYTCSALCGHCEWYRDVLGKAHKGVCLDCGKVKSDLDCCRNFSKAVPLCANADGQESFLKGGAQ